MVVGVVVAQVGAVVLGIVGATQAEALTWLLTVIVAADGKRDVVAPVELLVQADITSQAERAVFRQSVVLRAVDDGLAPGGVLAAAVAVAVGIVQVKIAPQRDGLLNVYPVGDAEAEVLLLAPRLRAAQDVAPRSERLGGASRLIGVVAPVEGGVQALFPAFVLVFRLYVHACLLGGALSLRHVAGAPVAVAARPAVLVDVVGVAEERHARVVVVVETEQPGHVAVVGAAARLGVGHVAAVVFALQLHVHHVVLLLHVVTNQLALLGALVEDLQLLHGVVGQVVEHDLILALEEVLAVQRQVVHLLAVDVDVAVFLQFCTRHLTDESVEHRAFGQVEGRGVVDQRVTAIGQLDLRARDDHAV